MTNENKRKHICTGLMAHVDSGKTTLSEALLYASGTIRKLGKVDTKDAFLDTDARERDRGITIFSNPSQFLNASFPSSLTVFGITISVNDVQPLKALSFIDSRQSLHSTFFKELQPSNACGHIVVTVFGS